MIVTIDGNKKINVIQKEFNNLFPYLKIEFLLYKQIGSIVKKWTTGGDDTLADYRDANEKVNFIITPSMSVAELEKKFNEIFGVKIQILRKSGKAWLETTITDKWTLEEQNRQGEELSKISGA
ncbi:MAG TPA: hypothetical protein VFF27_06090 [Bacteroidia bacterium]|nr:hypothetical protein [Bacteroidia bacterium]